MVFSLIVVSSLIGLGAAIFLGFVADAYVHLPAKARVEVRRELLRRR